MAKVKGAIVVDTERCKGCDVCVNACPFDVLAMSKEMNTKGYNFSYMMNPDNCTGCSSCGLVCPDGCIRVYRVKE
jgi:2-oxoglutarate ferredoxin oxidoreductase subunit delta